MVGRIVPCLHDPEKAIAIDRSRNGPGGTREGGVQRFIVCMPLQCLPVDAIVTSLEIPCSQGIGLEIETVTKRVMSHFELPKWTKIYADP